MGKYFGTDGFRGEANKNLTVEHAFKVGRFLGYYYIDENNKKGIDETVRVVIGKDTRRSSYMFEYALAAGITASGADAYLLHVTTTPSVSYVVRSEDFNCGIMISASHNPYYDNGIKLINSDGIKMEAHIESKIEDYIDGKIGEIPLATGSKIGRTVDYSAGRNRYIGHLISLATRSFKNKKVGLDCANGSSSSIAKSVFDALGAKTFVIHNEPNGTNINTDCGSTHIDKLQKYVIDNKLDVGFAYDGDADRCIAVDENGKIVDGDLILYACGKYLHENGMLKDNTIVTTIMSNLGLYKAFDNLGIKYEKTDVGDKYVYECMVKNGYQLGGEQSGHIIFSKYETTGDGILTSLMIMEAMLEKKCTLGELTEEVKIYPQVLKNIKVYDKDKWLANPNVKKAIEETEKELGTEGRVLVRKSGTEPLIRIMIEAATDELCEKYANIIAEAGEDINNDNDTQFDEELNLDNSLNVENTPKTVVKQNFETNKINPILREFLDSDSSYEKILIIRKHNDDVDMSTLISMELSVDAEVIDGSIEEHINYLTKVLEMKRKYEESRLRK